MRGRIDLVADDVVHAWVWDPGRPDVRLTARLVIDGQPVQSLVADRRRKDLVSARIGDGEHGARFALPERFRDGGTHDFVLDVETAVGTVVVDRRSFECALVAPTVDGRVEGFRQGRCVGWVWNRSRPAVRIGVEAMWGGEVVATARADRSRADLATRGVGDGAYGFELNLPLSVWLKPDPNRTLTIRTATSEGGHLVGTIGLPSAEAVKERIAEGRRAEQRGDHKAAAAALDEALRLDPDEVDALWVRARVAVQLGDKEQARRFAEQVEDLHPGHPRSALILARLAYDEGRYGDAQKHWPNVPPGDAAYRESLIKMARGLRHLGRPLEAIAPLLASIPLRPQDPEARALLGDVYMAIGAPSLALGPLRAAIAAGTTDRQSARLLARAEAASAPDQAMQTDPSHGLGVIENPTLREWPGAAAGRISHETELAPGLVLRPQHSAIDYRVVEPQEFRPGDPPHYGLRLEAAGPFSILRRLLPDAAALLASGLGLGFEARTLSPGPETVHLAVRLEAREAARSHLLWEGRAVRSVRLFRLELAMPPEEAAALEAGDLYLSVSAEAAASVVIHTPRPTHRLPVQPAGRAGSEGPDPRAMLQALRVPVAAAPTIEAPRGTRAVPQMTDPFTAVAIWSPDNDRVGLIETAEAVLDGDNLPFSCAVLVDVEATPAGLRSGLERLRADPRVRLERDWHPVLEPAEWVALVRAGADLGSSRWLADLHEGAAFNPDVMLVARRDLVAFWPQSPADPWVTTPARLAAFCAARAGVAAGV